MLVPFCLYFGVPVCPVAIELLQNVKLLRSKLNDALVKLPFASVVTLPSDLDKGTE